MFAFSQSPWNAPSSSDKRSSIGSGKGFRVNDFPASSRTTSRCSGQSRMQERVIKSLASIATRDVVSCRLKGGLLRNIGSGLNASSRIRYVAFADTTSRLSSRTPGRRCFSTSADRLCADPPLEATRAEQMYSSWSRA